MELRAFSCPGAVLMPQKCLLFTYRLRLRLAAKAWQCLSPCMHTSPGLCTLSDVNLDYWVLPANSLCCVLPSRQRHMLATLQPSQTSLSDRCRHPTCPQNSRKLLPCSQCSAEPSRCRLTQQAYLAGTLEACQLWVPPPEGSDAPPRPAPPASLRGRTRPGTHGFRSSVRGGGHPHGPRCQASR